MEVEIFFEHFKPLGNSPGRVVGITSVRDTGESSRLVPIILRAIKNSMSHLRRSTIAQDIFEEGQHNEFQTYLTVVTILSTPLFNLLKG
jgi:hypothetical protein